MNIKEIANNICTQDNRITDQPLFVVEREVTDWGYDSEYADDYVWMNHENDYEIAEDEKIDELEELEEMCESTQGFKKSYFKKRWEFVTACFTEKGCKEYLATNGHNLGKTRIYAHGSYRNREYRAVRNMLITHADEKAA